MYFIILTRPGTFAATFYDRARSALGDKVMHTTVGTRFVFGADGAQKQ
jgi:hypothetical protein